MHTRVRAHGGSVSRPAHWASPCPGGRCRFRALFPTVLELENVQSPPAEVESQPRPRGRAADSLQVSGRNPGGRPSPVWPTRSGVALVLFLTRSCQPGPLQGLTPLPPPGPPEAPQSCTRVQLSHSSPGSLFRTHAPQSAIRTRCLPGGAPLRTHGWRWATGLGGPQGLGSHTPPSNGAPEITSVGH